MTETFTEFDPVNYFLDEAIETNDLDFIKKSYVIAKEATENLKLKK